MKNKPVRHKETNTFKFKKFSERISEIDIDVFHRVAHRNEVDSSDEDTLESELYKTLHKWYLLNLTEGFAALKRDLKHVITLPQLLHHEKEVVETLITYIKKRDIAFLQPVLELVVALAKDLQQDFDKHFPTFLNGIIPLLSLKDPEILEYAFTTLAYLFKIRWRYFIKHIDEVFTLLLPLLVDEKPEYIRNFAAESFAFVARKVRDRRAFFELVLEALATHRDGVVGCGRLLFEVISGTTGQFHSCAEDMLRLYLSALRSADPDLARDVLQQIFNCVMTQIRRKHCQVFWNVVLETVDSSLTDFQGSTSIIKPLAELICLSVAYKRGRMVLEAAPLVERVKKMLQLNYIDAEDVLKMTIDLAVMILLAEQIKLTQELSSTLVSQLLLISHRPSLIYALEQLINHPSFETMILPRALQFSDIKSEFTTQELRLFSRIVLALAPPILSGADLLEERMKKVHLDLRKFPNCGLDFILNILRAQNFENDESVNEDIFHVLIILPQVNPVSKEVFEEFRIFFREVYSSLRTGKDRRSLRDEEKHSFLLLLAFHAAVQLFEAEELMQLLEKSLLSLDHLLEDYSHVLHVVKLVDLLLSRMSTSEYRERFINGEIFKKIHTHAGTGLACADRRFRLALAHIYSLFHDLPEALEDPTVEGPAAAELLYRAESVKNTVNTDRDRLIHLQALSFDSRAVANLDDRFHEFPVRFLMGNLYVNFSPLWTPVTKIIATFAHENCPSFWSTFLHELARDNRCLEVRNHPEIALPIDRQEQHFSCEVLQPWMETLALLDRPDYDNFKVLLWRCMGEFAAFAEAKNRDYVGLFIDFVEQNFFRGNTETSRSFSIRQRSQETEKGGEDDEEDDAVAENIEKHDEEGNKMIRKKTEPKPTKPSSYKLLLAQLNFFSRLQNPKTLYREPEIYRIYMELLTSRSSELQKAALDCVLAYRNKHLQPYKDNLYNLVDEKNLRNELARFKITEEAQGLPDEDRAALMPILLRLLYAKMVSRGLGRASGGDGALARRKIILRFLAGISESEMMMFARMAFKIFEDAGISFLPDAPLPDLQLVCDLNLDLENVIPPKRLRSLVNLLGVMIEEFGAKMSTNLLPRLLALVVRVLAIVRGVFQRSAEVHAGFLSTIKDLRSSCLTILARFFVHFERYAWTVAELDAVFDVGVFPWVEKLPIEGVHSVTPLLRLICAWGQHPRFFCLLVKHRPDDESITSLPFVLRLLRAGGKVHFSVINAVLEMLEKLLTLRDFDSEQETQMETDGETPVAPLVPNHVLQINPQAVRPGFTFNYGSAILATHVPDILMFIRSRFERGGINRTETTILARISELSLDPKTADQLVALSLPIVVKRAMRGASEDVLVELLNTLVNFMKTVEHPQTHLRPLLPLLLHISGPDVRKILLQLLDIIASRTGGVLVDNTRRIVALNSMDARWIDKPDYTKILDAFEEINSMITDDSTDSQLTVEFGAAVVYNCFYFLRHGQDLALEVATETCLKSLAPRLGLKFRADPTERKFLLEDTLLDLLRRGIKAKGKTEKSVAIGLLRVMALECPEAHPVFRDLNPLADRVDPEVDFFENLRHIQQHRLAKAFLKFCAVAHTMQRPPNTKTLTQFIFPVAAFYLCNDTFAGKNSIVDAAIEVVGTVCRLLPWHQYAVILQHYLNKLRASADHQKQLVRIIVAILDAFHYNLSKAEALPALTNVESEEIAAQEEAKEACSLDEGSDKLEDEPEELLNEQLVAEVEEEVVEEQNFAISRETVLSRAAAQRVISEIRRVHIVRLNRAILASTQHDLSHKSNRRSAGSEEEELIRVPIALALVRLLQKLPHEILDCNLPGIFMKLCTFLKSRLQSVRLATREVLQKIMLSLGPGYLHFLLREMNSLLTKGFQIHVLAFTIHAVFTALKAMLTPAHVAENLQSVLQVCKVDLFGASAEEKDVAAITRAVSEAKSTKSFDMFHILGEFIGETCLLDVMQPLVTVLKSTRSFKTVSKVSECLRHLTLGLADNKFITKEKMLIFIYGILSQTIPGFSAAPKPPVDEKTSKIPPKNDCFLIAPAPKTRMGARNVVARSSGDVNDHILIDFGLKLFHVLLKRETIKIDAFKPYLDPLVPVLSTCVKSQHVKISTAALQCLNWVLKMDMTAVTATVKDVCDTIFEILHRFGAAGLSKGDNFDLVMAAFKTMSTVVRDKRFHLSQEQMTILLSYAEQDLHDHERQATAFKLIKAIIGRKFASNEMHSVMKKVAELSVTSESDSVRTQCRSVFYNFLMEYPLGKELDEYLNFHLAQLKYETQLGRLSALQMVFSIVTGVPTNLLEQRASLFFILVGSRLVNDEDPACRELASKCIEEIISRVAQNYRTKLFDIVLTWMRDSKLPHRFLAAHLARIFVTVERESFESRLKSLLPLILNQFKSEEDQPGRFVKRAKKRKREEAVPVKDPERMMDHHLYIVLQLTVKVSELVPKFLKGEQHIAKVKLLAEHSQRLLAHPHLWVRLGALQQLRLVLESLDDAEVLRGLDEAKKKILDEGDEPEDEDKGFVLSNPLRTLTDLGFDLVSQLCTDLTQTEYSECVVANLVLLAGFVRQLVWNEDKGKQERISLLWIMKKIRKRINMEVTQCPKSVSVRVAAFQWINGVLNSKTIAPFLNTILFQMMSPLVREMMTTDKSNAVLRQTANAIAKKIKKRIGDGNYAKLLELVEAKISAKKAQRLKERLQEKIVAPELAAKRKFSKTQKSRKKRRME